MTSAYAASIAFPPPNWLRVLCRFKLGTNVLILDIICVHLAVRPYPIVLFICTSYNVHIYMCIIYVCTSNNPDMLLLIRCGILHWIQTTFLSFY